MQPPAPEKPRRVLTVAPAPPEKIAYALARYSRSPDSIQESLDWVRTHDSSRFLESFYFQYGHASIADLGHLVLCFEGISELAATEIEDEQLWDGQARSSRYQNFGTNSLIIPPEFNDNARKAYETAGADLLAAYARIHEGVTAYLKEQLPRPPEMKPDAYERNIAARAFDVARYCLPFGIPTGVGQVVSIRTLERQIRRMRASEYAELRELGLEAAEACASPAVCGLGESSGVEAVAPTLAKYVEPDLHSKRSLADLGLWAEQNLAVRSSTEVTDVEVTAPSQRLADIAATLLFPVTSLPYAVLYRTVLEWSAERQSEVIETALQSRSKRDELLRQFRTSTYVFDIVTDIGGYRDLHRHRRCQQFRQEYGTSLGYSVPSHVEGAALSAVYSTAMTAAHTCANELPAPGREYILPFATRARFLFKMDFAEAEYIIRLRTGVKGHFSYRQTAWRMKEELTKLEPELGKLLGGTPPWVEDPLTR